jgi:hypothetical protein
MMPERDEMIAAVLTAGMLASHAAGRWTGGLKTDVRYSVNLYNLFLREVKAQENVRVEPAD